MHNRSEPRNIAIFRALQLGDMLCVVPALRALRRRYPLAHITLIGLPWARDFVMRFSAYLDAFIEFPGFPGLPERKPDLDALPRFYAQARACRFDLVLQMHGSGSIVNPIVESLGATTVYGFRPDADAKPAHFPIWIEAEHEVLRYLNLVREVGAPGCGEALEFPILARERSELADILNLHLPLAPRPYVCVHPGARLPSRRWPPERFAAVADQIADRGYTIILTGSADEAPIGLAVRRVMRHPAINLIGKTSLGALAALVGDAHLIVSNDTGMSHIAAAMHAASVVVSSGSNVLRWAPLDSQKHIVLWRDTACRPCAHAICPTQHECALGVSVEEVIEAVARSLSWEESRAA